MDASSGKRSTSPRINNDDPIPESAPSQPFQANAIKFEHNGESMHPENNSDREKKIDMYTDELLTSINQTSGTASVSSTSTTMDITRENSTLSIGSLLTLINKFKDITIIDIPKNEISNLPPFKRSNNRVVVVTSAEASERAVSCIRAELAIARQQRHQNKADSRFEYHQFVGFDTETRPKFSKGGNEHPTAMIQIATKTTCYLFRIKYQRMNEHDSPMTGPLQCLLSDRSIIKVGVGIRTDVRALNREYGNGCCGDGKTFLDLMPLAKARWPNMQSFGLRSLTATVLHFSLSKAQQMKNWEMHTLTPAMEAYAAADAFVALDLLAAIVPHFDGYCIDAELPKQLDLEVNSIYACSRNLENNRKHD